ncbi:hypothetical protein THH46_18520 [Pseudomonas sp. NA13]
MAFLKCPPRDARPHADSDELLQYLRNGKLMQYLYGCNAQALITQADRASVSNRESRWAVLLKGASLLFNTLLFPLLRGPTMTVAWLWSLMAAASHDIPDLSSDDPVTRELAAVDLLVNLAMLVTQFPSIQAPVRPSVPMSIKEQAMHAPAPRLVAQQWPAPDLPTIRQGSIALPGEHPNAFLDFSFSNPRNRLTQEQRTRLLRMQVPRPASLPVPIPYGPLKGLYLIAEKWHALLQDGLYRIDLDPEGQITIIDPLDPTQRAPPCERIPRVTGPWTCACACSAAHRPNAWPTSVARMPAEPPS